MSLFAFGYLFKPDHYRITLHNDGKFDRDNPWQYLLADSPRPFRRAFGYIPDLGKNATQQYPPPLVRFCRSMRSMLSITNYFFSQDSDSTTTGPFDGVELPHATATSYGVQFRLPVATVDGITIAVMLCQAGERHFGLFLTRDPSGKDPQRPRYFVGCNFTKSATVSSKYLARMCELGDDLYNLALNGKPVKASWRTIYVVPTTSHLYSENATSPTLLINSNPTSRFHVPRWLVDRFTAVQFEVEEMTFSETLHVVSFVHRSEGRFFVSLGTCAEHRDLGPDTPPSLWAKVVILAYGKPDAFTHDCSEDHLDSKSWAARSKVFGGANFRKARLSFTSSPRMPETAIVIHLEPFGSVFERLLQEAGIPFPSLADLEEGRTASHFR